MSRKRSGSRQGYVMPLHHCTRLAGNRGESAAHPAERLELLDHPTMAVRGPRVRVVDIMVGHLECAGCNAVSCCQEGQQQQQKGGVRQCQESGWHWPPRLPPPHPHITSPEPGKAGRAHWTRAFRTASQFKMHVRKQHLVLPRIIEGESTAAPYYSLQC